MSGTEAAPVQPQVQENGVPAAHDAYTRLLHRLEPEPAALWEESDRTRGVLILDDSTVDKPYARQMDLVTRHWSGKHRRVVSGINLLTLLWGEGERFIPIDYRIYAKATDGKTKNDHFRDLLESAYVRGFEPECVLFDSWYSSLENLKAVRSYGWPWLTRLKSDRPVDPEGSGNQPIATCEIAQEGYNSPADRFENRPKLLPILPEEVQPAQ